MATFAAVAAFDATLQRKGLVGAVLVAPMSTAIPTAITTASSGALVVDASFVTLGKLSADGVSFGDSVTKQEQRGWGDIYPSRVDVSGEDATMTFTAIETRKASIDAFYGVDQSAVIRSTSTMSITFDKPPLPVIRDKRILGIFKDTNAENGLDIYMAICFPRANITQNGDQAYAFNEAGLGYPMQATALVDDTAQTPVRLFIGGPGFTPAMGTDMGYTSA